MTGLIRLGAWGAMLGGGLRIATALIPYSPDSATLESIYAVVDISLLFGLIAVYLNCADRVGAAGLAGFALAMLRQRIMQAPALCWLSALAMGILAMAWANHLAFAASGIAFGAGFVIAGGRLRAI